MQAARRKGGSVGMEGHGGAVRQGHRNTKDGLKGYTKRGLGETGLACSKGRGRGGLLGTGITSSSQR